MCINAYLHLGSNTQITIRVEGVAQGATSNFTECAQLDGSASSCGAMKAVNCTSVHKPGNRLVVHYSGTARLKVSELEVVGYQYPCKYMFGSGCSKTYFVPRYYISDSIIGSYCFVSATCILVVYLVSVYLNTG